MLTGRFTWLLYEKLTFKDQLAMRISRQLCGVHTLVEGKKWVRKREPRGHHILTVGRASARGALGRCVDT